MSRVIFSVFLVAVLLLTAVVIVRTAIFGPPAMRDVPAPDPLEIDPGLVAGNLAKALRIQTVSHSGDLPPAAEAFAEFHDFLSASFPRVHRAMAREIVAGHSLLFTWPGRAPGLDPILFSAHMDVVPVEPGTEADWTYPAFSGQVADGFVWGRGALDMKQSLTAYMEAAEALLAAGFVPERTIYFAFTHDEELGAEAALEIAALLEARGVRLFYTLDEGLTIAEGLVPGVVRPVALIGIAQKGYLTVELGAQDEGGHSSMPPVNPMNARLARAVAAIVDNPMPARLAPPATQMFEYLAPEMSLLNRAVLANRWLLGPVLMARLEANPATNALIRTTFAPTVIESGFKPNVLPQQGRAVFNIRILPGDSVAQVRDHVRARIADPGIEVRIVGSSPSEPSAVSDPGSRSFRLLRRTVRQIFPDAVQAPGLVLARTDSRSYERIAANSYLFLPSRLTAEDLPRIHGTNERIAVENYAEIIRFYAQLMRNTAVEIPAGD